MAGKTAPKKKPAKASVQTAKPKGKRGSLNRLPMVRSLIAKCAAEMEEAKPTKSLLSEFVRLLALEKELAGENEAVREIKVTWVEPVATELSKSE